jgi:hypothetical protein
MNLARWLQVGTREFDDLARARTETINLVQWLARIANSYIGHGPPERRTDLDFRAADAALVTQSFNQNLALELRLPSLELQFIERGRPVPHSLDPEEHSPAEVEAWILVELLHRGIDRDKFSKQLPYTIADLMSGDALEHSPGTCRQGLAELTAWLQNAAAVLDAAASAPGAPGTDLVRIVCLPQTLALTCLRGPNRELANFGFLPGDARDAEPFFYTGNVEPGRPAGRLRCSVLKASELLAEKDPVATAIEFVRSAAD